MSVTFTPNIGLAKPDETELGKNWAADAASRLCEDNNLILVDKMDIGHIAYVPTFVGPTTNPSNGVGDKFGEYLEIQGFIFGSFTIICLDPGVAIGSGSGGYGISLPTLVDTSFHTVGSTLNDNPGIPSCIGEGYFADNSAVNTSGTLGIDVIVFGGVAYARMITETFTGKGGKFLGPGGPVSLATGDRFSGNFCYKKA